MDALLCRLRQVLIDAPAAAGDSRAILRGGAAFNRLEKAARGLRAKAGRKGDQAAEAEAVEQLRALFDGERTKLRVSFGVTVGDLAEQPAAPAEQGGEPTAPVPAPRPRPVPAPRRFGPQPLKLAEGETPGEPLEVAVDRIFNRSRQAALEGGASADDARHAGINAALSYINERLVDLSLVSNTVLAIARSAEHVLPGAAQGFQWVRLTPNVAGLRLLGSSGDICWAKVWLGSAHRRQAQQAVFLPPRGPNDAAAAPPGSFNTWSGMALPLSLAQRQGGRADGPGAVGFKAVVDEMLADHTAEERHWLVSWLASCVRQPGVIPKCTPVLSGPEGTGKGFLYTVVSSILGSAYCAHPSNTESFLGRFGAAALENRVLVFVDELFSGDKQGQEGLKKTITEEDLLVERKGIDAYTIRNCAHVLIATNNYRAVQTGGSSRRFAHFSVSGNGGRPRDLAHLLEPAALADIACFLHTFEGIPAEDLAGTLPRGEALFQQRLASLEGVDEWFAGELFRAKHGTGATIQFGRDTAKRAVYEAYISACRDKRYAQKEGPFWAAVARICAYETARRGAHGCGGAMAIFPALEAAAENAAGALGIPVAVLLGETAGAEQGEPLAADEAAGAPAADELAELVARVAQEAAPEPVVGHGEPVPAPAPAKRGVPRSALPRAAAVVAAMAAAAAK